MSPVRMHPPRHNPYLPIGGIDGRPDTILPGNLFILGSPASGKSKTLEMMMRGLLPYYSGFVFDEKGDVLQILQSILPAHRIANLHLLDAHGYAWDLGRDLASPLAIEDFIHALIPKQPATAANQSRFWDSGGRSLGYGTALGVKKLRGRIDLRDLLCALSPEHIYDVLGETEVGRRVITNFLTSKATAVDRPQDLIATVSSHVDQFIPVAMAMEHHEKEGRTFSLNDWVKKLTPQTCIRVAHDASYEPALDPWLGVMLRYLTRRLRSRPGNIPVPDFVFFLDEVQSLAAHFPELPQFMALSRSKGVSTIAATQTLSGLRVAFQNADAAAMIQELSRTQIFLRTDSPEVARLASTLAGQVEYIREQVSWGESESDSAQRNGSVTEGFVGDAANYGRWPKWIRDANYSKAKSYGDGRTRAYNGSTTLVPMTKDLLPAYELLHLPQPTPRTGMRCFCRVASVMWAPEIDPRWIDLRAPRPVPGHEPPLDLERLTFRPWSKAEVAALFKRKGGFFDDI